MAVIQIGARSELQAAIVEIRSSLGGNVIMAKAPAAAARTTAAAPQGYCMKCKTQREMKSAKQITMKNGRPATEGLCPECGTRMFKIGRST